MSRFTEYGPFGSFHNQGRILIVFAAILWSLAGVFIKSLELPATVIVFYRSLFAGLFFMIFLRRGGSKPRVPLLVSVVSYTAAISSFVWANKLTTAANAIVLQYTAPIFVYLYIRFGVGNPIARNNLVTLIFGMLGVAIIFSGSAVEKDIKGVSVAVTSGLLFSVYMINLRFLKGFNPLVLNFFNNLVCVLVLLPLVEGHLSLNTDQFLALGIMGVVQLGIPYFLFSKGLETLSLEEASLIVLIEPVLNPIWVASIVGEIPSATTLIGGGLILGSLGLRYLLQRGF